MLQSDWRPFVRCFLTDQWRGSCFTHRFFPVGSQNLQKPFRYKSNVEIYSYDWLYISRSIKLKLNIPPEIYTHSQLRVLLAVLRFKRHIEHVMADKMVFKTATDLERN